MPENSYFQKFKNGAYHLITNNPITYFFKHDSQSHSTNITLAQEAKLSALIKQQEELKQENSALETLRSDLMAILVQRRRENPELFDEHSFVDSLEKKVVTTESAREELSCLYEELHNGSAAEIFAEANKIEEVTSQLKVQFNQSLIDSYESISSANSRLALHKKI